MCHILSGGQTTCFVLFILLNRTYVPCAVKMCHLLTAACQYVSYFVRWTNDWLVLFILLNRTYVPCAVKMCHL